MTPQPLRNNLFVILTVFYVIFTMRIPVCNCALLARGVVDQNRATVDNHNTRNRGLITQVKNSTALREQNQSGDSHNRTESVKNMTGYLENSAINLTLENETSQGQITSPISETPHGKTIPVPGSGKTTSRLPTSLSMSPTDSMPLNTNIPSYSPFSNHQVWKSSTPSTQLENVSINNKITCPHMTHAQLSELHGTAFNPRYMATHKPYNRLDKSRIAAMMKKRYQNTRGDYRHQHGFKHREFFVEKGFRRDLPDSVLYKLRKDISNNNKQNLPSSEQFIRRVRSTSASSTTASVRSRTKRRVGKKEKSDSLPWQCESRVYWQDLGEDYYPRYLRGVICLSSKCWFKLFHCRAKAFTVKVLRRNPEQCVPVPGSESIRTRYEEHWILEERAITFCCECALS